MTDLKRKMNRERGKLFDLGIRNYSRLQETVRELPYIGIELEVFARATNWKRYYGKKIDPFIGKTVLEVGAGLGEAVLHLGTNACQNWLCLEPDSKFCDTIQAKISSGELPAICSIYQGKTESLQKEGCLFDTILYIDVLEHVEDDRSELKRAFNLLEDHGVLIILVPAHTFLFSPFDDHIGHYRRYNKKRIKQVCPVELKIERLEYLDSIGMIASMANRLLLRNRLPTLRQITLWDKIMIPISRIIDPLFFNHIGKSLLAVIRK